MSIILVLTDVYDAGASLGGVKGIKNVKEEDYILTLIPLTLFIIDNAFNCTPMTHRHLLFTLIMQGGYAIFNHIVCPDLYPFEFYTELVMLISIIVHLISYRIMVAKL